MTENTVKLIVHGAIAVAALAVYGMTQDQAVLWILVGQGAGEIPGQVAKNTKTK